MASTSNGSAYRDGDTSIWSVDHGTTRARPNPLGQISAGGLGRAPEFATLPAVSDVNRLLFEKQYLPGQPISLSGIAMRAFLLGLALSTAIITTVYVLFFTQSPLWRLPAFLAALSLFHFLEFWTTAHYNTRSAQISSFLLSQNGSAYNIAHAAAIFECLVKSVIFPRREWTSQSLTVVFISVGFLLVLLGQIVRSVAMMEAGTNFNHIVQHRKASEHQLVTGGVYHYLRHPSYFGFFWWGLGTQLVLGNLFCFIAYAIVLWRFFATRISGEEELLVAFFGDEYVKYREKTGVWIPLIA